jgi:hypothetical protein
VLPGPNDENVCCQLDELRLDAAALKLGDGLEVLGTADDDEISCQLEELRPDAATVELKLNVALAMLKAEEDDDDVCCQPTELRLEVAALELLGAPEEVPND